MCDFPDKAIKFSDLSCVLNCCSECSGIFVTNTEMNGDGYMVSTLLCFYHFENISFCSLHKNLLPDRGKLCPFTRAYIFLRKERLQHERGLYQNHE